MVDGLCGKAARFAEGLGRLGFEIVNPPVFNQFMAACQTDEKTGMLLRSVQEGGVCWCGGSTWKGHRVIRVSVCSWEDIDRSTAAFGEALSRLGEGTKMVLFSSSRSALSFSGPRR